MIWFVEDTEAHYDANGTVTRAFGHVSMGTPVFRLDRNADAAATVEYQFHGLANNTIAAIDQTTGAVNASFSYAPFGEIIEATDAGAPSAGIAQHRRRMNDKFVDEVSDLAYYGFRYYDKTSMTWTQSDPLFRFAPDSAWVAPRFASLYVMRSTGRGSILFLGTRRVVARCSFRLAGTAKVATATNRLMRMAMAKSLMRNNRRG